MTAETILARAESIDAGNREAWLAGRSECLGSSDAAGAVGVSPFDDDTPLDVWLRKTGRRGPKPANEAMEWGTRLEPLLADAYRERTGQDLVGSQLFLRHEQLPWMTATLDAVTPEGRIVELKTASAYSKDWGEPDTDRVPEHYVVQVHHQMLVSGAEVADVAVLIGGQRFQVYTIARDEVLCDSILDRERRFWDCVERREPPDWGRLTAEALAILNPECWGETDLGAAIVRRIDQYAARGEHIKGLEALREEDKVAILGALGSHQFGRCCDGRLVKRYLETSPERQVSYPRKASTRHYFRVLKTREP